MIHQLTEDTIAVTVPEDAADIVCSSDDDGHDPILVFTSEIQDPLHCGGDILKLPPGNWDMIGKASELTPSDWEKVIPVHYSNTDAMGEFPLIWYRNYNYPNEKVFTAFAHESGLSLLRKHNLNPETTIILKKQL